MNTSVGNEFFKRNSCDFATNGVKSRKSNDVGSIVDNKVDARRAFQSADIAPYPSDNAPFHFVVGKGHDRNGGIGGMVGGATLNGKSDNILRFFLGVFFCLRFDVLRRLCGVLFRAVDKRVHKLRLCFVAGHTRNAFEFLFKEKL